MLFLQRTVAFAFGKVLPRREYAFKARSHIASKSMSAPAFASNFNIVSVVMWTVKQRMGYETKSLRFHFLSLLLLFSKTQLERLTLSVNGPLEENVVYSRFLSTSQIFPYSWCLYSSCVSNITLQMRTPDTTPTKTRHTAHTETKSPNATRQQTLVQFLCV